MCDDYGIRKVDSLGLNLPPLLKRGGDDNKDKQQHLDKKADTTPLWSLRLCF